MEEHPRDDLDERVEPFRGATHLGRRPPPGVVDGGSRKEAPAPERVCRSDQRRRVVRDFVDRELPFDPAEELDELEDGEDALARRSPVDDGRRDVERFEADYQVHVGELAPLQRGCSMRADLHPQPTTGSHGLGEWRQRTDVERSD